MSTSAHVLCHTHISSDSTLFKNVIILVMVTTLQMLRTIPVKYLPHCLQVYIHRYRYIASLYRCTYTVPVLFKGITEAGIKYNLYYS